MTALLAVEPVAAVAEVVDFRREVTLGGCGRKLGLSKDIVHVLIKDRVRAVELYMRLGKRAGATILQLGYPTKNALKGWHREYENRLDLPVGFAVRVPEVHSGTERGRR